MAAQLVAPDEAVTDKMVALSDLPLGAVFCGSDKLVYRRRDLGGTERLVEAINDDGTVEPCLYSRDIWGDTWGRTAVSIVDQSKLGVTIAKCGFKLVPGGFDCIAESYTPEKR